MTLFFCRRFFTDVKCTGEEKALSECHFSVEYTNSTDLPSPRGVICAGMCVRLSVLHQLHCSIFSTELNVHKYVFNIWQCADCYVKEIYLCHVEHQ